MMPYYSLFILFVAFLLSCHSTPSDSVSDDKRRIDSVSVIKKQTESFTRDSLTYSYHAVRVESPYLSGDSDNPDTSYSQIRYPVFSDGQINALVHNAIFVEGEVDPQQAVQSFVDGYNEFVEEETTKHLTAWIREVESSVVLQTNRLLTICTRVYEYAGGAHGHSVDVWSNYDLQEMQKIQITDLIDEAQLPQLTALAEQKFRKAEGLREDSPLDSDFFFNDGLFALNDNFGLTEKELIFYYNEYEIKPYAQGTTTVRIAYDELAEILNQSGRAYISNIRAQAK